jgi:hypothetical protein
MQLPDNSLHTQPFQKPTQVLFPYLNHTRLETIHPDARACFAYDFLERIAEPIPAVIRMRIVVIVVIRLRIRVFFLCILVFEFIVLKSRSSHALLPIFPLLLFFHDLGLSLRIFGFRLRISLHHAFFRALTCSTATETHDDVEAATFVETRHDELGAPVLAFGAVEFDNGFGDPEGEFGEGAGVCEEGDVGAFFDHGHAEGAEMADLFLLDELGAGAEDGAVEMLCGGDVGCEEVDGVEGVVGGPEAGGDVFLCGGLLFLGGCDFGGVLLGGVCVVGGVEGGVREVFGVADFENGAEDFQPQQRTKPQPSFMSPLRGGGGTRPSRPYCGANLRRRSRSPRLSSMSMCVYRCLHSCNDTPIFARSLASLFCPASLQMCSFAERYGEWSILS